MKPKTIVVFESKFGNTQVIAEAIAEGLRESCEVRIGHVDEIAVEEARDAALVVAGGPTQRYGITERLRGWLERLPGGGSLTAAFDTRYDRPRWLTGSAAVKAARILDGKGYPALGSQSFLVRRTRGPLVDGERERALAWGRELAASAKAMNGSDRIGASA